MTLPARSLLFRCDALKSVADPAHTRRDPGPAARAFLAVGTLAAVLTPVASRAAWQPGGNLLGTMGYGGRLHSPYHVVTPERPGSCLVWLGFAPSPLWRVDANGDTHGIWPNPTIYPGTPGGSNGEAAFASDGAGGFIAVWRDYRNGSQAVALYAQHITAAGAIAPGWPDSGATLSGPTDAYGLLAVPDGSGGAFVMWARPYSQLNVQHISGAGEVAQPGGVQIVGPVVGTQDRGILVPDGAGGAIVVWVDRWNAGIDPFNYDLFAQRVDRGLNFAWGPTGAEVTKAPHSQDYPVALPDGAGGAFIAWPDQRNSSSSSSLKQDIYGLHLASNGARAPGWAQGGNPMVSSWAEDPRIATDGAGGALISSAKWQSGGAYIIEIDDVTPSGGKTSFRSLSIPLMMGATGLNDTWIHDLIADGNGGAFVAWTTTDNADFVLHLGPDGEPAPGWDLQGARVDGHQWDYVGGISLASDGAGGAFVLFERAYDERVPHEPTYLEYLYATRVLSESPNPLEVPPSVAPHFALGGARPNPAGPEFTVAFELPDASPAWIELMDLAGRRIVAREVGSMGPGEHRLRLGDSRDLTPGLYHVRLTRGGRSLTAGVALIR